MCSWHPKTDIERVYMFQKKVKKHPYMSLAVVSLAAAGMINLTRRAKNFMKRRITCIKNMIGNKMSGN